MSEHLPSASPERVFAARMKHERLRRGWRQEDLARHVAQHGLDLHPSAFSKIESDGDPRMIRLDEASAIAAVFHLPLSAMVAPPCPHCMEAEA